MIDYRKWAGFLPPTNNAPLRGGKGDLTEGGLRSVSAAEVRAFAGRYLGPDNRAVVTYRPGGAS